MPGSASDIAGAVFFDPITRRIPKIHLDTKHLAGQIYIHLRSVIEVSALSIRVVLASQKFPLSNRTVGDEPRHTKKQHRFG
jgi:hypothetical protein